MTDSPSLSEMNDRTREVFRRVVEGYLETGDPVGSRTLTRLMSERVSAATVRNVMQDLEYLGLLGSPHVSAGRVPTEAGLRMFVDGFMEVSSLSTEDRDALNASVGNAEPEVASLLDRVGATLSGLTHGASLVLTPKREAPLRHVEFLPLSADRALAVLVFGDGHVENRVFVPPPGQTPSSMREAANFLNAVAAGKTLAEVRNDLRRQMDANRAELDTLARELVESGLAIWENRGDAQERLIVRGRSNLLDGGDDVDLTRIRTLFDDLERQRDIVDVLDLTEGGQGVRIFIGSENKLFSLSGSSLVVSPYMNADRTIVGAVGVIGPTRLNYGRIVPIVDYTAQLVGRLLSGGRKDQDP